MPRIVITHAVADIESWLEGKAERAAAIESGSGSNVTDFVAKDGSNNVAITADVADVDGMQAMLASPPPEVAAKMQEHGVVPPITAYVEATSLEAACTALLQRRDLEVQPVGPRVVAGGVEALTLGEQEIR